MFCFYATYTYYFILTTLHLPQKLASNLPINRRRSRSVFDRDPRIRNNSKKCITFLIIVLHLYSIIVYIKYSKNIVNKNIVGVLVNKSIG